MTWLLDCNVAAEAPASTRAAGVCVVCAGGLLTAAPPVGRERICAARVALRDDAVRYFDLHGAAVSAEVAVRIERRRIGLGAPEDVAARTLRVTERDELLDDLVD